MKLHSFFHLAFKENHQCTPHALFSCSFDSCGLFFFPICGLVLSVNLSVLRLKFSGSWVDFFGCCDKFQFLIVALCLNFGVFLCDFGLIVRMANRNIEKMASIDAQLRLLVPAKVSEDDKLVEYDALLLDRFLDILQDLHGEDLKETVCFWFWILVDQFLKNFMCKVFMLVWSFDGDNWFKNPIPFQNGIYYENTQFNLIFYFNIFVVLDDGAGVLLRIRVCPDHNFVKIRKIIRTWFSFWYLEWNLTDF